MFLFDLLYLNGESLTQKPLNERRTLLKEHFQEVEEKFTFVTSMDTNTMEEVQEFLDESVKGMLTLWAVFLSKLIAYPYLRTSSFQVIAKV